jgi:hypothetical protein
MQELKTSNTKMVKYSAYLLRESGMPVRSTNKGTDRLDFNKGNPEWVGDEYPGAEFADIVTEKRFKKAVADWVENTAIDVDKLIQTERVRYDPVFPRIDDNVY